MVGLNNGNYFRTIKKRLLELERKDHLTDTEYQELTGLRVAFDAARNKDNKEYSKEPFHVTKEPFHVTKKPLFYALFGFIIVALLLLFPLVMPLHSSTSAYVNEFLASNYYVKITANPDVDMSLITTSNFAATYQRDTILVTSNTPNYDIYLSTVGGNNSLYLDGDPTQEEIPATSKSGSKLVGMSTNSWGYAVDSAAPFTTNDSTTSDIDDLLYYPVPAKNSETKIISFSTNQTTEVSSTYDVYYGVKANKTKPSGTYSNSIMYSAVSNVSSGDGTSTISPNKINAGDSFSFLTDLTTNMDVGTIDIKLTNMISNTDYSCNAINTALTNNMVEIICDAPSDMPAGFYNVLASIPKFSKSFSGHISVGDTFFSITYMQEMTSAICATATTPSTAANASDTTGANTGNPSYVPERQLIDTRDNKSYYVRKLADGNCWMTQNFDLNLSTSKTLTSADTDLNSKSSWTPSINTQTSGTTGWNSSAPYSFDNGNQWLSGGTSLTNSQGSISNTNHRGNFYNWFAATAGSGTASMTTGVASDSICPKGWQLPNSGTSAVKSYYNLMNSIYGTSSSVAFAYPLNFIAAGIYNSGSGTGFGSYWANASYNTSSAYRMYFYFQNGGVVSNTSETKSIGDSIRCVAR